MIAHNHCLGRNNLLSLRESSLGNRQLKIVLKDIVVLVYDHCNRLLNQALQDK